jgi:hypothetical protein
MVVDNSEIVEFRQDPSLNYNILSIIILSASTLAVVGITVYTYLLVLNAEITINTKAEKEINKVKLD